MSAGTKNLSGRRFDRLLVQAIAPESGRKYTWRCLCDCGTQCFARTGQLRHGTKRSCGCFRREVTGARFRTHGESRTRLHRIWRAMRARCANRSDEHYGGKGIRVCDEWGYFATFREWALLNGYEDTLEIDRKENDGHYEPHNCRWATRRQQTQNSTQNVQITVFGETKVASEWARDPRCAVNEKTLRDRIRKRGWDAHRAVTLPARARIER